MKTWDGLMVMSVATALSLRWGCQASISQPFRREPLGFASA